MWGRLKDWLYDQYRSLGPYSEHWRAFDQMALDRDLRAYRMEQYFYNRPLCNYDFTEEQWERYQSRVAGIHLRLDRLTHG
jgi:hypothetical protein